MLLNQNLLQLSRSILIVLPFILLLSCNGNDSPKLQESKFDFPKFQGLTAEQSGIEFSNNLNESPQVNYFTYEYSYNGGGVAIADLNRDGLPDIYFTGNQQKDALYLNKGNLKFEDHTNEAIPELPGGWHSGVTIADVNKDGWPDIYVSRSGPTTNPAERANLLFIHQGMDGEGNIHFKEKAAEYGLADTSHSTQAAFFDYDKDGDLDMYMMGHPVNFKAKQSRQDYLAILGSGKQESDRLYRNDNGKFVNISAEAGINDYACGLGIAIGDVNQDGWDDIYISNDYDEPDQLYINTGRGFRESLKNMVGHTSNFGMGNDMADFNNDGLLDLVQVDMAYGEHVRSKMLMPSMSSEKFWKLVREEKHYQYMRNTLQLNRGPAPKSGNQKAKEGYITSPGFSEMGQLAGIPSTDWSWAPLLADFDNDGLKDLFITNGYKRDINDQDYQIDFNEKIRQGKKFTLDEAISLMPSTKVRNQMFQNQGDLHFKKTSKESGFELPVNSNGAAYGDLDNDGDLDLVINHLDAKSQVFENISGGNSLRIKLKGSVSNPGAYGTTVKISYKGNGPDSTSNQSQILQLYPSRGYQSSVEPILHFGLKGITTIDQIEVLWPDGKKSTLADQKTGITLELFHKNADGQWQLPKVPKAGFLTEYTHRKGLKHFHQEVKWDDFKTEILLPHKQSEWGPCIAVGDVNNDGLDDFFVGGSKGYEGAFFVQSAEGEFKRLATSAFSTAKNAEDLGACFLDIEGDGDQDLYVVTGSNEFSAGSKELNDRLYLNDGKGNFSLSTGAAISSGSAKAVVAADFDGDGDQDLFVGGQQLAQKYPASGKSFLLKNENGRFEEVTEELAPGLSDIGMVQTALFTDIDGDQDPDLLLAGEWMPVTLFINEGGSFQKVTEKAGFGESSGWWYSLATGDFDEDGDLDIVAGNLGANNKFHPKADKPFKVWASDFDNNGTNDIVLGKYQADKLYPVRGRECSSQQMPFIAEKFPTFKDYAEAEIDQIYSTEQLEKAVHKEVKTLMSMYFRNEGNGTFAASPLPPMAQLSPIMGIIPIDLNNDGHLDLVTAGNIYGAEVETIRYDAGKGLCLLGDGKGNFSPMSIAESGLFCPGNVKSVNVLGYGKDKKPLILVGNNNNVLQAFLKE